MLDSSESDSSTRKLLITIFSSYNKQLSLPEIIIFAITFLIERDMI